MTSQAQPGEALPPPIHHVEPSEARQLLWYDFEAQRSDEAFWTPSAVAGPLGDEFPVPGYGIRIADYKDEVVVAHIGPEAPDACRASMEQFDVINEFQGTHINANFNHAQALAEEMSRAPSIRLQLGRVCQVNPAKLMSRRSVEEIERQRQEESALVQDKRAAMGEESQDDSSSYSSHAVELISEEQDGAEEGGVVETTVTTQTRRIETTNGGSESDVIARLKERIELLGRQLAERNGGMLELRHKLQEFRRDMNTTQEERDALRSDLTACERARDQFDSKARRLQREYEELRSQHDAGEEDALERIERASHLSDGRVLELEGQLRARDALILELEELQSSWIEDEENFTEKIEDLGAEVDVLTADRDQLRMQVLQLQDHLEEGQEDADDRAHVELAALRAELAERTAVLMQFEQESEQIEGTTVQLDGKLQRVMAEVDSLQAQIDAMRAERDGLQQQLGTQSALAARLEASNAEATAALRDASGALDGKTRELAEALSKLSRLQEAHSVLEGRFTSLKAQASDREDGERSLQKTVRDASSENRELHLSVERLTTARSQLESQLAEAKAATAKEREALEAHRATALQQERSLSDFKTRCVQAEDELREKLRAKATEIDTLHGQLSTRQVALDALKAGAAESTERQDALRRRAATLDDQLATMVPKTRLSEAEAQVTETARAKADAEQEVAALQAAATRAKAWHAEEMDRLRRTLQADAEQLAAAKQAALQELELARAASLNQDRGLSDHKAQWQSAEESLRTELRIKTNLADSLEAQAQSRQLALDKADHLAESLRAKLAEATARGAHLERQLGSMAPRDELAEVEGRLRAAELAKQQAQQDASYASSELQQTTARHREATDSLKALHASELEQASVARAALQGEVADLKAASLGQDRMFSDFKTSSMKAEDGLRDEVRSKLGAIDSLQSRLSGQEVAHNLTKLQVDELTAKLSQLRSDNSDLQARLAGMVPAEGLAALEARLKELQREKAALEQGAAEGAAELHKSRAVGMEEMGTLRSRLEAQLSALQAKAQALETRAADAAKDAETWRHRHHQLELELNGTKTDAGQRAQDWERKMAALNAELLSAQTLCAEYKVQLAADADGLQRKLSEALADKVKAEAEASGFAMQVKMLTTQLEDALAGQTAASGRLQEQVSLRDREVTVVRREKDEQRLSMGKQLDALEAELRDARLAVQTTAQAQARGVEAEAALRAELGRRETEYERSLRSFKQLLADAEEQVRRLKLERETLNSRLDAENDRRRDVQDGHEAESRRLNAQVESLGTERDRLLARLDEASRNVSANRDAQVDSLEAANAELTKTVARYELDKLDLASEVEICLENQAGTRRELEQADRQLVEAEARCSEALAQVDALREEVLALRAATKAQAAASESELDLRVRLAELRERYKLSQLELESANKQYAGLRSKLDATLSDRTRDITTTTIKMLSIKRESQTDSAASSVYQSPFLQPAGARIAAPFNMEQLRSPFQPSPLHAADRSWPGAGASGLPFDQGEEESATEPDTAPGFSPEVAPRPMARDNSSESYNGFGGSPGYNGRPGDREPATADDRDEAEGEEEGWLPSPDGEEGETRYYDIEIFPTVSTTEWTRQHHTIFVRPGQDAIAFYAGSGQLLQDIPYPDVLSIGRDADKLFIETSTFSASGPGLYLFSCDVPEECLEDMNSRCAPWHEE